MMEALAKRTISNACPLNTTGIHASPTCVLQFGDNGGQLDTSLAKKTLNALHVHNDEPSKVSSGVRGPCCG